jgi:hypothetical protein
MYYNTASKTFWISDGTQWNQIQGSGGGGGPAYADVSATAPNPNAPVITPPEGLIWIDTSTNPSWAAYTITGPTGPAGVTGPTGAAGAAGSTFQVITISATTTLPSAVNTEYVVKCIGTLSVNLPPAPGNLSMYTIVNASTGAVTLVPNGGDVINGFASGWVLQSQYDSITIISDGANWMVLDLNFQPTYIGLPTAAGTTSGTTSYTIGTATIPNAPYGRVIRVDVLLSGGPFSVATDVFQLTFSTTWNVAQNLPGGWKIARFATNTPVTFSSQYFYPANTGSDTATWSVVRYSGTGTLNIPTGDGRFYYCNLDIQPVI